MLHLVLYYLDWELKPGELYGSTTNQEGAGAEKKAKKRIPLPYMRPKTSLLLDLPLWFSDMFRVYGGQSVGHDLQCHYLAMP